MHLSFGWEKGVLSPWGFPRRRQSLGRYPGLAPQSKQAIGKQIGLRKQGTDTGYHPPKDWPEKPGYKHGWGSARCPTFSLPFWVSSPRKWCPLELVTTLVVELVLIVRAPTTPGKPNLATKSFQPKRSHHKGDPTCPPLSPVLPLLADK